MRAALYRRSMRPSQPVHVAFCANAVNMSITGVEMENREHADDLLRRALLDSEATAAVALRVAGLPLCEQLTVVFHGRRDLGTIQTYVTHGGRGAGAAVRADELLRVPCDLDLAEAGDRGEAQELYAERARALRDAIVAADTVLSVWREPLAELADGHVGV